MDVQKNATRDLDLLNRLKPLSFLSPDALLELASCLNSANFRRREVILPEEEFAAGVHILLRGVAKITCLSHSGQRVTIALLAPGPIPQFVSLPVRRREFRCEAQGECRVGSLSWDQFDVITRGASQATLRNFYENNRMPWYRFFSEGLDLHERLLVTLLQLCSTFGVRESRGTLLRVTISQKDLAGLVGASRPRVTEQLAELVREHLLIRQGRQMIVCLDKIDGSTSVPAPDVNYSYVKAGAQPRFFKQAPIYSPGSVAAMPFGYRKPAMEHVKLAR
ncbi:MAG: Crp/Fnr family transcriptional regulator [Candidatus Binatus sp.]|jgi:CRP/FNR family cyclic AMP-dependent transcriptional regulator|uniref:Crp/Fnr family transcriptional regulator n=1 Tax=Candidatus Binatus sp. TaxID=2811406 RepID=UPI003C9C6B09